MSGRWHAAGGLAALALAGTLAQTAWAGPDCARYRLAGLPCPAAAAASAASAPAAAGRVAPVPARPPARSPAPAAPAVPVAPAAAAHSSPAPSAPALPARADLEAGQVAVWWDDAAQGELALARLARRNERPVETAPLRHLGGLLALFQWRDAAEALAFRDRLRREDPGVAADFNTRYRPQQGARPRLYAPQKLDLPPRAAPAAGWRIGLVDGPVAPIAALAGGLVVRRGFLALADRPADAGHATALAALIAGRDAAAGFAGSAAGASLYVATVMRAGADGDSASSAALLRAFDWLLGEQVQLVNLSLGGPGDAVLARAFERLARLPLVLVAAAGNGGPAAGPAYPAAYSGVIAVTAVDAGNLAYALAGRGAHVALAAPGVDLWVPDEAGGRYLSGTSFAAALVSGGIALLLAQGVAPEPASVARRLCRTALDLGPPGRDPVYGCGLAQFTAALRDATP